MKDTPGVSGKMAEKELFPAGPILDVGKSFAMPHVKLMGMSQTLPLSSGHTVRVAAPAIRFLPRELATAESTPQVDPTSSDGAEGKAQNGWSGALRGPPQLAEHTEQVLREVLRVEQSEMSALERDRVIQLLPKQP